MTLKDLELGITSYCEQRVAPMLQSTFDKWIFYAGLALMGAKMEAFAQSVAPAAAAVGVIDGDGNLDMDTLEKVGYAAFEKQPRVQIWKLTFIKEDFGDFMRYLRHK